MGDYIDRQATIDYIEENKRKLGITNCNAWNFKDILRAQPAADVAPVVHGRWVYDENATDWGIGGYICSECKNKNNNLPCNKVKNVHVFSGSKFCPNCGAKMDKEATP